MNSQQDIEKLYNCYVNDMFTYASYLGFERQIIMDAIHDVFCKLFADSNTLSNVNNVKFFLFRSLKNRLLDICKFERVRGGTSTIAHADEAPFELHVSIEDEIIGEEEQTIIKKQIEDMLGTLTDRQREIIYLRYVQGYDYEEVSQLLNISVNSCRKLVSKAISSLRERFGNSAVLIFLFV